MSGIDRFIWSAGFVSLIIVVASILIAATEAISQLWQERHRDDLPGLAVVPQESASSVCSLSERRSALRRKRGTAQPRLEGRPAVSLFVVEEGA